DERGTDALTLVLREHLGMDEGQPTTFEDRLEEDHELVFEVGLRARALKRVRDHRVGGVGHRRDAKRSRPSLRPEISARRTTVLLTEEPITDRPMRRPEVDRSEERTLKEARAAIVRRYPRPATHADRSDSGRT